MVEISDPNNAVEVNLIADRKSGNIIGNNNIGNNPLLTEATEDIADIKVPALDIPVNPKITVINKIRGSLTEQSNSITNIGKINIETNIIDKSEKIILPNKID